MEEDSEAAVEVAGDLSREKPSFKKNLKEGFKKEIYKKEYQRRTLHINIGKASD